MLVFSPLKPRDHNIILTKILTTNLTLFEVLPNKEDSLLNFKTFCQVSSDFTISPPLVIKYFLSHRKDQETYRHFYFLNNFREKFLLLSFNQSEDLKSPSGCLLEQSLIVQFEVNDSEILNYSNNGTRAAFLLNFYVSSCINTFRGQVLCPDLIH